MAVDYGGGTVVRLPSSCLIVLIGPAGAGRSEWEATNLRSDPAVGREGFDGAHSPGPVQGVPAEMLHAPALLARQKEDPMPLRFGLQLPSFTWPGGPTELAGTLSAIAAGAEDAGFSSLWVMDHFL